MSAWLAALILAGAVTATYLFCVRPMRRGECGPTQADTEEGEKEREVAELRQEVARLREEIARDEVQGAARDDAEGSPRA